MGVGVTLLLLAVALFWFSRPARVTGLILARAGDALGLEISASGISEYRLRGTPQVVVRGLVARQPGAQQPLLVAERVYLSLPWATLRAAGDDLTVRRVEIDAPRLDIAALQRWLDTRPAGGEVRLPTLTDGLRIVRGEAIGDGWSVDRLGVALPSLLPDRALAARVGGRFRSEAVTLPFDLQVAATRLSPDAGIGAAGIATVATADWRLPMRLQFSGRLHAGDGGFGLDRFKLGADSRWLAGTGANGTDADNRDLAFAYGLSGWLRYRDGRLSVAPLGVALRGHGLVPELDARGVLAWRDALSLHLDGVIAQWPDAWPALPPSLGGSQSRLPFVLDYTGPADLQGDTALQLRRDEVRFEGRFRVPEMLGWFDRFAVDTPLPPLDGTLHIPQVEVAGASLTGIQVEFDDSDDELPR